MRSIDLEGVRELLALRARLDRLTTGLAPSPDLAAGVGADGPATDIFETDEEVVVEFEVPGADPASLALEARANHLTLRGEVPAPPPADGRWLRCERAAGRFERSVALPSGQLGAPDATLRAGVLTVRLRRLEGRRPVQITVEGP